MFDYSPPTAPPKAPAKLKTAGLVALALALAVAAVGVFVRMRANQQLAEWTEAQSVPTVALARIKSGGDRELTMPGDVQAFYTAPIHARVSGYLKRWYAEIGQPVKSGQLLAEIDTPELDQQVLRARADLATAEANRALSKTTADRWTALVAQDAVSRQEADEKQGDLAARTSLVNAARANLNQLLAMAQFKRVTAPFDGVVTVRSTDIGALISAGSGQPLYTVADQRRLRIYVRLPQNYSAQVHRGSTAQIEVPEYPGQTFEAQVVNLGEAVVSQTGTMLVELQIDNADGRLKSGEYARVTFDFPSGSQAIVLPATAVTFRANKPMVAVLDPQSHVRFRPISISRDFGASVEIGSGVAKGDRIVDNPPETLVDGQLVRLSSAKAEADGKKG
jgi:RND family efflux transporter MFP subunit